MNDKLAYLHYIYQSQFKLKKYVSNRNLLLEVDDIVAKRYTKKLSVKFITIFSHKSYFEKFVENNIFIIYYTGCLEFFLKQKAMFLNDSKPTSYVQQSFVNILTNNQLSYITVILYNDENKVLIKNLILLKMNFVLVINNSLDEFCIDNKKLCQNIEKYGMIISFFIKENKQLNIVNHIKISRLVVLQLSLNSKLFNVINYLIDKNVLIYCLPARVSDLQLLGNNKLIDEGCQLIEQDYLI